MAKIGEQQFFALQRLKSEIERLEGVRVKVDQLKYIDEATDFLRSLPRGKEVREPFDGLKAGKKYKYRRDSWPAHASQEVTIEAGRGDKSGELFVRSRTDLAPTRVKDIPHDGIFEEVE